ncbi:protein of unknown function [Chryseobacterium taichungense]|uniref:DUF4421 domain-containing protein n=1 Tax=Chryseobacterium taichungense TaxID=295069 RepID=A0A1H7X1F8_9FLAO|nr:DUF4421 family protein [Chryseobacterium taichungense]SEM26949.1 protein of unknown function [Chryseobacterium taichungense]
MKVAIPSFLFFFFPLISFAQEVNDEKTDHYLEEDKKKISVVGGLSYLHNSFGLLYEHKVFRLRPNDAFYTEFFLRYRWVDVSFSFAPKLTHINNDDPEKGKSKYFNFGFTFFLAPKIRQYVYFSQVKGLYFQDTKEFMRLLYGNDYNEEGYLQFPDAKYRSFKGETTYLWVGNKKDYRSFNNMTYQPLKDVFVVSTGLFYQYNILSDIGKTVYLGETFSDSDNSPSKDFRIALRSGGGIQKKIKNNWYAIVEVYPELYYAKLVGENFHEFNVGIFSNARIGYDNGKWFFGGGAQLSWVNSSNENFYSTTQWLFRAGIGFRFNSPTFVNRNFDKIDNILK